MKWKPIETAPPPKKNGTEILLFNGHNMRVASWQDTLRVDGIITCFEWVYAEIIEEDEWPDFLTVDKPTHWSPKPLPPKNDLVENCNLDYHTVKGNSGRRAEICGYSRFYEPSPSVNFLENQITDPRRPILPYLH